MMGYDNENQRTAVNMESGEKFKRNSRGIWKELEM